MRLSNPADGWLEPEGAFRTIVLPVGATLFVLSVAIIGSIITGTTTSAVTAEVEGASSSAGGILSDVSLLLPLGFAFSAGMVSAVNPCGFTMLPAYLGLYLGTSENAVATSSANRAAGQLRQALIVGLSMTAGFILLFAVVGILIGTGAQFVVDYFPWIGLAIGVMLAVAGGWLIRGGTLYSALGERLASHIGDPGRTDVRGYFLFGLSYGTASLSCTLPIFITVIGGSIAIADFLPSVWQFVLYGLGMGSVILALTLSLAVFKTALLVWLKNAMVYVQPVSAVLMLAAGGFIVYYWLTFGQLLDDFS
jgi:cytochrome c biogenesis protein CcdA